MDLQALSHPYTPGAPAGPESLLLVWDAPNLDMGLGAILGGRPTAAYPGRTPAPAPPRPAPAAKRPAPACAWDRSASSR